MALHTSGLTATPLGGVGEIGMNMMVYSCDDSWIVVDAGILFPDESCPGTDVVVQDIAHIRANADKVKAIIITHAHEDHVGGMPYLWDELPPVPVYCTKFTRLVLEDKLSSVGESDFTRIREVAPGQQFEVGPFNLEYIHLTHSILEGNAVAIRTPYGTLLHTGDYKFDMNPAVGPKSNTERLKEIGDEGVLAMFGDSTNIFNEGHSGSEGHLADNIEDLIGGVKGRLFFATFASNAGRVIRAAESAVRHGRKIAFLGRSMDRMMRYAEACGYFPPELNQHIVEPEQAGKMAKNKVMIFVTGTQGEPNASLMRLSGGATFRGVSLDADDTIILSSKMIPGNERKIYNMINSLMMTGARVVHEKGADIHVSGHAARDEIKMMYELVRPQIAVPVHGEYQHLVEQAAFAEECGVKHSVVFLNGDTLHLGPESPYVVQNAVPAGRCFVDGLNILDADRHILKDRKKLSYEGVATVTVVTDMVTGEIISGPFIKTKGIIDENLQPEALDDARREVLNTLGGAFQSGRIDDIQRAEELMRQAVRRSFLRTRGRKPLTIPTLVEISPND